MHPSCRALILAGLLLVAGGAHAQASKPETAAVAEARVLLDTYYGKRANLVQAGTLLLNAYVADRRDPHVFVQAARATIMGGYRVLPWAAEGYAALLDHAIALDPAHAKAHILRAEAFNIERKPAQELASLDRARALGTQDPWLQMGYARYFFAAGRKAEGLAMLREVEKRGKGTTPSEQKAYIEALYRLTRRAWGTPDYDQTLARNAAVVLKERHPDDGFGAQNFADLFLYEHRYDEAIVFARAAVASMDTPSARVTLCAALYAQAATHNAMHRAVGGPRDRIDAPLKEAAALQVPRRDVWQYFQRWNRTDSRFEVMMETIAALPDPPPAR